MSTDDEAFRWGALLSTPRGWLALSLLAVELLTGIQMFLANAITPLLAQELDGRALYGVATAASQVSIFLTMPLGAALMHRFSPAKLMVWLTPVTVLAGIAGALSPTMWFYIGTRVVAGLAAGILATAGMGALVTSMPPAWRQLVLAANNIMWLLSAVLGPLYAAGVSHAWGWRWAMVLYLPLLLIARWVIARQLDRIGSHEAKEARLPLAAALLLSGGIALLTAISLGSIWGWIAGSVGFVAIVVSVQRILPDGVLTLRPGSRAALGLLGMLSIMVFAADAIVTILAHDVLGFDEGRIGILLGSMSIGWSAVGLVCGKWPVSGRAFRVRGMLGMAFLTFGLVALAWSLHGRHDTAYIVSFLIVGIGMGLVFLDALNIVFTPDVADPLDPTDSSAASVVVQQVGGATFMTIATSIIALRPGLGPEVFLGLAALGIPTCVALWRATAQSPS